MVNFGFFESLAPGEAEALLRDFLAESRDAMPEFLTSAAGVGADFSVDSVPPLLDWIGASVTTQPRQPDPELPEWIRASETYARYLFDFDQRSRLLVVRGAYYLGESFAQSFTHLRWAVGRRETAPQGQPVITGFKHGMELPVLLVVENTIARDIAEPSDTRSTAEATTSWLTSI